MIHYLLNRLGISPYTYIHLSDVDFAEAYAQWKEPWEFALLLTRLGFDVAPMLRLVTSSSPEMTRIVETELAWGWDVSPRNAVALLPLPPEALMAAFRAQFPLDQVAGRLLDYARDA